MVLLLVSYMNFRQRHSRRRSRAVGGGARQADGAAEAESCKYAYVLCQRD
jgi:hypothetical protein